MDSNRWGFLSEAVKSTVVKIVAVDLLKAHQLGDFGESLTDTSGVIRCAQGRQAFERATFRSASDQSGGTNGAILAENTSFNSRLQPSTIQALNGSNSLLTLTYAYGTDATHNNGNMHSQAINDGTTTRTQTYGYDAVNRLSSATEGTGCPSDPTTLTVPAPGPNWCQYYVYDPYGNRALYSKSNDAAVGMGQVLDIATSTTTSVPFDINNHWNGSGVTYTRGNLSDVVQDN
jgi:hypothetical protein